MVLFQDPDEIVRIKVRRKTREELKRCGIKGETYEVIIRRLIEGEGEEEKK
jgi:hypothetical protein